jgi:hypothetical protein
VHNLRISGFSGLAFFDHFFRKIVIFWGLVQSRKTRELAQNLAFWTSFFGGSSKMDIFLLQNPGETMQFLRKNAYTSQNVKKGSKSAET